MATGLQIVIQDGLGGMGFSYKERVMPQNGEWFSPKEELFCPILWFFLDP